MRLLTARDATRISLGRPRNPSKRLGTSKGGAQVADPIEDAENVDVIQQTRQKGGGPNPDWVRPRAGKGLMSR